MALLIKGRKMPKACAYCICNDDSYRCGATGDGLDVDQWEMRMPNCPLIEVPDFQTFCICDYDALRCWDEDGNEMRLVKKGNTW